MRNQSRMATRPTRFWVVAAAICFIPTLLIVDASHTAAVGQVMFGHRGGFRAGIGLGVGIGGMIGNQAQREPVEDSRGAPARTQTKRQSDQGSNTSVSKRTSKNKKKPATTVATKKNVPDLPSKQANDLTSKPAEAPAVTRATPASVAIPAAESPASTKLKNCSGCNELWLAVIRHQDKIAEDEKKLAATQQKFEQDVRYRDWLKAQWRSAKGDVEKDFNQQMISTTEKAIDGLIEQIDKLRELIKEEKARLAQRVAEYKRCVDAGCAQNVAESPAAPRSSISVGAAPLIAMPEMPASVSR